MYHNSKNKIENNLAELLKENKSGTCLVRFVVDKDGRIMKVVPLSMQGTKLSEMATHALEDGPRWIPATQNGVNVSTYWEQPVSFKIQ